ncbi:hypothetical protein B0H66DRAFT_482978 [Apodospora peruviana]|uniref:Uncharacterized protein n=1 Tax=Apodospora peruviana TaxID=516989 RepID=A0AAE0M068_9PEZI|nr:hypothetical protein B0H66DRAFT_482978 [Apodospora peruviana]
MAATDEHHHQVQPPATTATLSSTSFAAGGSSSELWDQIEAKYWESIRAVRADEDRKLELDYETQRDKLQNQLIDQHAEMTKVMRQLEQLQKDYKRLHSQADDLSIGLSAKRAEYAYNRQKDDEERREQFRAYRKSADANAEAQVSAQTDAQAAPPAAAQIDDPVYGGRDEEGPDVLGGLDQPMPEGDTESELTSQHSTPVPEPPGFQIITGKLSSKPPTPGETSPTMDGVEVLDGLGQLVGRVRHINLDNHWVNHVKQLPIKRQVNIRLGRKFTAESLESIYEPSDAKGAKWLSCYIQATGEIQGQPCHTCLKNVGVFNQCVILGGEEFPRCGNCEWNRQGCHGAAPLPKSRQSMADESAAKAEEMPVEEEVNSPVSAGGFTAVNNPSRAASQKVSTRGPTPEKDVEKGDQKTGQSFSSTKPSSGRKSLPSQRKSQTQPSTAANTPLTGSPAPETDQANGQKLPEINKSVLALRDDGVVFTEPLCMRGVPLVKITPDHPYWEKDWAPLEGQVEATLQKWMQKHEQYLNAGSAQSSKFLANRQVNRGKSILKFLQDGELHPYQILAKPFLNKQLTTYDTLFRMVQVLEELRKFSIDVTPSQWLRQRLHEISVEQGSDFNLGRTVHDLYHDPKISELRTRMGFGNIGRPSGYKMEKGGAEKSTDPPPKKNVRIVKRKEPHTTPKGTPASQQRHKSGSAAAAAEPNPAPASATAPGTPTKTASQQAAQQQTQQHTLREHYGVNSPRESKRQRRDSTAESSTTIDQDLKYDGYTSADSFSHDHVMAVDWRVYQVKHAAISTNEKVTQYWHFIGRGEGGTDQDMFEHQVLKDVLSNKKVTWGVYKEPYDFHLRLSELTEATYAAKSNKVVIGTKQIKGVKHRGDVLVHFKRERTKKRFLAFLRKKGVKLLKATADWVETTWKEMDSEVLPHYDSE